MHQSSYADFVGINFILRFFFFTLVRCTLAVKDPCFFELELSSSVNSPKQVQLRCHFTLENVYFFY